MNNKSLSDLTSSIVASRQTAKETFIEYRKQLDSMKETLKLIPTFDKKGLWSEIISETNNLDKWEEIKKKAATLRKNLYAFIGSNGEFTIAESRAHRNYVNIGSIGIMREGKSEFVAQTTHLDKWVLPRKKGEHACTTASINVINGTTADEKSEIVRVYYYTVVEIVALFKDYLDEFGLKRDLIDDKICTRKELKEWCVKNKSSLESKIPSSKSKLKKKFMEYLEKVNQYSERLIEGLEPNEKAILYKDYPLAEIKEGLEKGEEYYSSVSYYKSPDSKPGEEVFTSFATSKAEIYTQFDVDGDYVENIQFLDTPGIGEKKVGVDRILSDAVAMNLDIIVAIRALNGNAKEEQEQSFVNILRNRLNGKDYASEWVYYLLNIWDGQDYSVAESCIEDLRYHLTTGNDTTSIVLSDDHFKVINLHDGYQLNSDGSTDSNNPIGKYLKSIFSNLIPKIDKIDNEFFSKATTMYADILKEYNELYSLLKSLPLPVYDDYDRIERLIEELQHALENENAKNPKICTSIQHNIDEFCNLADGTLVSILFNAQNPNFADSDDFYNKNKDAVQKEYTEGSYNSNYDFQTYSNLKTKLTNVIKAEIERRIDQTEAEKILSETKDELAKVFITAGRMGFITNNSQEWFEKSLELLNNEGYYPNLVRIISNFANHEIQIMQKLQFHINTVIQKCIHHDDFGDPEDYDFQVYENAALSITHSLFTIEEYAKGLINDGLVSADIELLQKAFSTLYFETTKFAASTDAHVNSELRKELHHFYKNHSEEVFKGDKTLEKSGLVTSWQNSLKAK